MKVKVTNPPAATCMCGLTCSDRPSRWASRSHHERPAPSVMRLALVRFVCFAVALEPLYVCRSQRWECNMGPCSHLQCNRRTQELGLSRSLREARDLPRCQVCRGVFENLPHCPPKMLQCSRRQQSWPATTNHQAESKGRRLPACWNLRSRMGSAPWSRLPTATVLGLGRRHATRGSGPDCFLFPLDVSSQLRARLRFVTL